MELTSSSFANGEKIPTRLAFAVPADPGPIAFSDNRNPHLAWTGAPDGTRSYVVTCIDHDCPSAPDDVNQPDREIPETLPRIDFTHWLLANIPASTTEIAEGSHSEGVTTRGKAADAAPIGVHGQNDYTSWTADDPDLAGQWNGYDGSAPPWNDSIVHHYEFTVFALDVDRLDLAPGFTRDELTAAMAGHVLDSASIVGAYATNPRLH
ncbi:MAG TPA: YbhB/YbcL family Raf kinase inhibitor-like protein [Actinobacteria bacterium]|nr:putative kinase inhibitor protein [bacterium BMS3Bbin02]HDL41906.1 YbhB/YbcL family Raf kinase inhibitor-like protein [Actinomycetota bacterium]